MMLRANMALLLALAAGVALAVDADGAPAQDGVLCANATSSVAMSDWSPVATVQEPAKIVPGDGPNLVSSSPALKLTLRPTAANPNSPFTAQVFARKICGSNKGDLGQLLGEVSFYPLKVGQSQEFVLAAPSQGFPSVAPEGLQLTVKLVSANPNRVLDTASVEVVKARFVK